MKIYYCPVDGRQSENFPEKLPVFRFLNVFHELVHVGPVPEPEAFQMIFAQVNSNTDEPSFLVFRASKYGSFIAQSDKGFLQYILTIVPVSQK